MAHIFSDDREIESPIISVNKPAKEADIINHPPHYTQGGIECVEAIRAMLTPEEFRGALKANVLKYLWRELHKGGLESLKKARWYLDRLIEAIE